MKTQTLNRNKIIAGLLVLLACATANVSAQQQRTGGGGYNGFGGFGGFGGGGNNANRGSGSSGSGSSTYNNNGNVGNAVITVDPQTHNIVVIADAETSQQISNVIANLDTPEPQVLIKVVFMEVEHNNSSDIGIEGGWAQNNIGNGIASSGGNTFGLSGLNSVVTNLNAFGQPMAAALSAGSGTPSGLGTYYQIVGSDFQATLRAIAQSGKAQILSRPSVLARDGQLANIVVGQQVPLPTSVSYNTSSSGTVPIVNVTYTDIGIILNVTPFIGANGLVEMIIQPQTSAVNQTQSQTIAPGVAAPYIDVRSADTVVVTPDGQTVVIGGLMSNSKSSSDSKVPFLGDIPLLGNLFKSKSKSDAKTELLIFLTPHIVESPSQLAMVSGRERANSPLINKSVTEHELDEFLDRVPVIKNK